MSHHWLDTVHGGAGLLLVWCSFHANFSGCSQEKAQVPSFKGPEDIGQVKGWVKLSQACELTLICRPES